MPSVPDRDFVAGLAATWHAQNADGWTDTELDAATARAAVTFGRIADTPAMTVAEAAAKLRVHLHHRGETTPCPVLLSAIRDLDPLAGVPG